LEAFSFLGSSRNKNTLEFQYYDKFMFVVFKGITKSFGKMPKISNPMGSKEVGMLFLVDALLQGGWNHEIHHTY
jgi:hypothetical protein